MARAIAYRVHDLLGLGDPHGLHRGGGALKRAKYVERHSGVV